MTELERRVARARVGVEPDWSEERARTVERGLVRRRRRRRAARGVAAALALLIAAAIGVLARWRAPSPEAANLVRFADGSTAAPLDATSRVRAGAVEPGLMVAELERGGARFEVVRDPSRRFRVEAGEVAVEVLGTRFTVERLGERAQVAVERGRVRVSWRSGSTELGAGERGLYPPLPEPLDWRRLADEGDYDAAWQARRPPSDEPGELLAAADVARLSHHPAAALEPLGRVADHHPLDPRAPLAAFTLGRVLLDELGRPREAAAAFAHARALAPAGPLSGDALAREVESWSRAGEPHLARLRALQYLRDQPSGDRLGSVRRHGGLE